MELFNSAKRLYEVLNDNGYICTKDIALTVYLAYKLNKPILIQGEPGCGKTELAKKISYLLNKTEPIRLQCYDGLTSEEALYSWNYQKQLLYIEANKDNKNWQEMEDDIYSEQFISPRPLYKAIKAENQQVLLIDEIDKVDEDFESFLLEFLAELQISISEYKTIKANNRPLVFITSNDKRELSDAFKRRCLFLYIEHPKIDDEIKIVMTHLPQINSLLVSQIVSFVDKIRKDKLNKTPSISETIDWAKALISLNVKELSPTVIKQTMNILLKTQSDVELEERKISQYIKELPKESIVKAKDITEISDNEWNF